MFFQPHLQKNSSTSTLVFQTKASSLLIRIALGLLRICSFPTDSNPSPVHHHLNNPQYSTKSSVICGFLVEFYCNQRWITELANHLHTNSRNAYSELLFHDFLYIHFTPNVPAARQQLLAKHSFFSLWNWKLDGGIKPRKALFGCQQSKQEYVLT